MEPSAKPVSPFLSIWFRPRATIRRIVDTDPFGMILNMPIAVVSWQERGLAPEAGRYAQLPDIILTAYPILVSGVRLWVSIIYYQCYGEVHGFSAWRAWGASMLAGLVVGVPLACIVVVIYLAFGG